MSALLLSHSRDNVFSFRDPEGSTLQAILMPVEENWPSEYVCRNAEALNDNHMSQDFKYLLPNRSHLLYRLLNGPKI